MFFTQKEIDAMTSAFGGEETPPSPRITAPMHRPAAPTVELPSFSSVEHESQVRPCYVCGQPSVERGTFPEVSDKAGTKPSYSMPLHHWCWQRYGGGLEAEKAAGRR